MFKFFKVFRHSLWSEVWTQQGDSHFDFGCIFYLCCHLYKTVAKVVEMVIVRNVAGQQMLLSHLSPGSWLWRNVLCVHTSEPRRPAWKRIKRVSFFSLLLEEGCIEGGCCCSQNYVIGNNWARFSPWLRLVFGVPFDTKKNMFCIREMNSGKVLNEEIGSMCRRWIL